MKVKEVVNEDMRRTSSIVECYSCDRLSTDDSTGTIGDDYKVWMTQNIDWISKAG